MKIHVSGAPKVHTHDTSDVTGLGTLATQDGTFSGTASGTNTGDNTNFAPPLGADDNYVTDAEKVVIGNTSGTNTGDQTSIAGIIGTIAQFNTALTGADFATGGGTATGINTGDQTLASLGAMNATAFVSFAKITVSTSTPASPSVNDLWVDLN